MLTIESLTNSKIVISLLANNSNHTLRGSTSRYNNITLFSEASPNFDNDDNDAKYNVHKDVHELYTLSHLA